MNEADVFDAIAEEAVPAEAVPAEAVPQPNPEPTDPIVAQMINELRHMLQQINETYKEVFHFNILTLVDLAKENAGITPCDECVQLQRQCLRGVIGYELAAPHDPIVETAPEVPAE